MSAPQKRDGVASQLVQQTDLPMEPLTPADSRRAEEDALHRTLEVGEEAGESRRRGRIEAETRRISEEVTRDAQARIRLERERSGLATAAAVAAEDQPGDAAVIAVPGRALPEPQTLDRILIGLDGTPYSERSLPYALAIAARAHASIVLAHVREPEPGLAHSTLSKALGSTSHEPSAEHAPNMAAYLDTLTRRVSAVAPHVEIVMLSAEGAADGLAAAVEQTHSDLVVLATHARQGLERRILGSVGDQLIQRTRVPLLLIPPGLDASSESVAPLRRVLVPLDGSVLAEQALAPVLALARQVGQDDSAGMDIVLFYVADSQVTRPEGARYVQDVRERLLRTALPASVRLTATALVGSAPGSITSAAVHGAISEPTYPKRFDLVVMATHGRGGFQRWLYGSVAEYVLSRVSVPTLLVRPESTEM